MDERLRRLERDAENGSPDAVAALQRARCRRGDHSRAVLWEAINTNPWGSYYVGCEHCRIKLRWDKREQIWTPASGS